eukprot:COSAG01_NODE_346_length_18524_cov_35.929661_8_plen_210_part_00
MRRHTHEQPRAQSRHQSQLNHGTSPPQTPAYLFAPPTRRHAARLPSAPLHHKSPQPPAGRSSNSCSSSSRQQVAGSNRQTSSIQQPRPAASGIYSIDPYTYRYSIHVLQNTRYVAKCTGFSTGTNRLQLYYIQKYCTVPVLGGGGARTCANISASAADGTSTVPLHTVLVLVRVLQYYRKEQHVSEVRQIYIIPKPNQIANIKHNYIQS